MINVIYKNRRTVDLRDIDDGEFFEYEDRLHIKLGAPTSDGEVECFEIGGDYISLDVLTCVIPHNVSIVVND